jgi:hypothetical protein
MLWARGWLAVIPSSEPIRVDQAGAFLDCVKTYCSAMQKANRPMPLFGKENAGLCFATAADDPDVVQQQNSASKPLPARNGKCTRR